MNNQFEDKVVYITGAANGIGKAAADVFSERGAKLALCDTNENILKEVTEDYQARGIEVLSKKIDVTEKDELFSFSDQIISKFGRIDICVPNAGAIGSENFSKRKDYIDEDWEITYSVNVKGLVNTTDSVKDHMIKNKNGKIVIVSSQGGRKPRGVGDKGRGNVLNPYLVSKAAAIQFTHTLAIELGKYNINVNTVCPGRLYTSFWQQIAENHKSMNSDYSEMDPFEIFKEQAESYFPLKRAQEPRDVAYSIAFLASDEASEITGQALNVNGGGILN